MSKRKEPPATEEANRTSATSGSAGKARATLSFDDDEAPERPKWGSDPDAIVRTKADGNNLAAKLATTTNPNTHQKTDNATIIWNAPFGYPQPKIDAVVQDLKKKAFGGNVTGVSVPSPPLHPKHSRALAFSPAEASDAQRTPHHGQISQGTQRLH